MFQAFNLLGKADSSNQQEKQPFGGYSGDHHQDNQLQQSFMSGLSQFGVQSFSPGAGVQPSTTENQVSNYPNNEMSHRNSFSRIHNEACAVMDRDVAISDLNITNV